MTVNEALNLCNEHIIKMAARTAVEGMEVNDLIQEGRLGVLMALSKFEEGKGEFIHYACSYAKGYMLHARRKYMREVHSIPYRKPVDASKPVTDREKQVLTLVASGRTRSEIAHILGVSKGTVAQDMYILYRKLGVTTRSELRLYMTAVKQGIIPCLCGDRT